MDYRLTDRHLDPPGQGDSFYSEKSIRLPDCFWCYTPYGAAPDVNELPAMKNGFVTFGCLNQFCKISRPVLDAWIELLRAAPTSRLMILAESGAYLDSVRDKFRKGGVDPDRVIFVPRVPHDEYFRRYLELDLSLDPFPFNGHTSTMDSLWMGVPVITVAGHTSVARGGVSILNNVGLPELIAKTPAEYVALAMRWANDLPGLATLRAGLRDRMLGSPIVGSRLARNVEVVYRDVWRNWCSGRMPTRGST